MILRHRRNCNEEKSSVLYHLRYDSIITLGTVQVPAAGKAKERQEEQRQQDDSESKASYLSQFDAGSYVELRILQFAIPVEANEGDTSGIENGIGDYLLKNSTFVKELPALLL